MGVRRVLTKTSSMFYRENDEILLEGHPVCTQGAETGLMGGALSLLVVSQ